MAVYGKRSIFLTSKRNKLLLVAVFIQNDNLKRQLNLNNLFQLKIIYSIKTFSDGYIVTI